MGLSKAQNYSHSLSSKAAPRASDSGSGLLLRPLRSSVLLAFRNTLRILQEMQILRATKTWTSLPYTMTNLGLDGQLITRPSSVPNTFDDTITIRGDKIDNISYIKDDRRGDACSAS